MKGFQKKYEPFYDKKLIHLKREIDTKRKKKTTLSLGEKTPSSSSPAYKKYLPMHLHPNHWHIHLHIHVYLHPSKYTHHSKHSSSFSTSPKGEHDQSENTRNWYIIFIWKKKNENDKASIPTLVRRLPRITWTGQESSCTK